MSLAFRVSFSLLQVSSLRILFGWGELSRSVVPVLDVPICSSFRPIGLITSSFQLGASVVSRSLFSQLQPPRFCFSPKKAAASASARHLWKHFDAASPSRSGLGNPSVGYGTIGALLITCTVFGVRFRCNASGTCHTLLTLWSIVVSTQFMLWSSFSLRGCTDQPTKTAHDSILRFPNLSASVRTARSTSSGPSMLRTA